jgi:predicted DNA-binding transcriptional regulator AlpA
MSPVPHLLQSRDLDSQASASGCHTADLLTQKQVCQRLGISEDTWTRWRKAQRVPEAVTLPSGRRKWRVVDIDAMLQVRPTSVGARRRFFGSVQTRAGQLVAVR